MSDATTGVPAANASVRTMPKLSPPSDGAHSTSASCSRRHSSASSTRPSTSMPSMPPSTWASSGSTPSASAPIDLQAHRDVLAQAGKRRQQHRQALALLLAADEHDPQRVAPRASARVGAAPMSTPFGITS